MTFYGGLSSEHLKQFVERVERLEEEKASIADDIKLAYQESKSNGFDPKIVREVVRVRNRLLQSAHAGHHRGRLTLNFPDLIADIRNGHRGLL